MNFDDFLLRECPELIATKDAIQPKLDVSRFYDQVGNGSAFDVAE